MPILNSTKIQNENKVDVRLPRKYRVVLHNDDYTPMEFVIEVLQSFFAKSYEEAFKIMMDVHNSGSGVCGVYSKEVAESKSVKVNQFSSLKGFPLKSSIEPE